MEVKAIYRFARMSAFKLRDVTREIQGHPVARALDIVAFSPKKAAFLVQKTLKSAIANAPKARGSAGPIRKRTSHIFITLSDEIEVKQRAKKGAKSAAKKTAKVAPKQSAEKSKE
jgi:large subunit ribosomal protein L22